MQIAGQIVFALVLLGAGALFFRQIKRVRRNILLGRNLESRTDRKAERWKTMLMVALGQQKMVVRPIPAMLHAMVYIGFLVINAEMIEIVIDGVAGTHRVLGNLDFLRIPYMILTGSAEVFMFLVFVACVIFLYRRNVMKIDRFNGVEMSSFPRMDANIILWTEIVLVLALIVMNATDIVLMQRGELKEMGFFPLSMWVAPLFDGYTDRGLHAVGKVAWWFHILGILAFLNYLPFSKHFHIMMAFPNTWYSKLEPKGKMLNDEKVKKEVELMFSDNPYATPEADPNAVPQPFGAKDVFDLTWKNLMEAYTCTECGRCTNSCPANITGKLLSPRKIMMDTRDRLHEVGENIDANGGKFVDDGKSLLYNYITPEELWACTTCNACVEACPVNIDPPSIILQLRQYLVMEESKAPEALNAMFNNIQNNGAPWAMPAANRFNWADNINVPADKVNA